MTAVAAPPRERPILFSGPMVRAILDGRKTQTRRVVAFRHGRHIIGPPTHDGVFEWWPVAGSDGLTINYSREVLMGECPYGQPGDRLWVRETFWRDERDAGVVIYAATAEFGKYQNTGKVVRASYPDGDHIGSGPPPTREQMEREMATNRFWSQKPSIHMPRWASRLTLDLTEVRVERLQEIGEAEAIAEGCFQEREHDGTLPTTIYRQTWDELNAKRGFGWHVDPWVWVLSFRRVEA